MNHEGINLIGEHAYTILEKNDFRICKFKAKQAVLFPDGASCTDVTVKGYGIPTEKKIFYKLSGHFEEYRNKHDGKIQYTFVMDDYEEVVPTDQDAIIAYLMSLKGIGKKSSEKLYSTFGKEIFSVIEKDPDQLCKVNGISLKKAKKIQNEYLSRNQGHKLFLFLFRYGISSMHCAKIYKVLGSDAIERIKQNPYVMLDAKGIGFKTVDVIAKKMGFARDFEPRIEAAILEVLMQSEKGGSLFNPTTSLPGFLLNAYLRPAIYNLINENSTYNTGNVFLTSEILYLMTLKLLEYPVDEKKFYSLLYQMHQDKRVFISVDREKKDGEFERLRVYRYHAACAEYRAAKKIVQLMRANLEKHEDLKKVCTDVQKKLSLLLSDEQQTAVLVALENPVSIITGGPGTGKTSVQKAILEAYQAYYPNAKILLAAPTGRAAKRMAESTGYPASTLHKALMLYADDEGSCNESDKEFVFDEKLIIVDETSMIGSFLLERLLDHIAPGTRLIFVGDIDQLPSIEVGAVLRELINSNIVPVTKLTKTFRQASGSSIITNAARIKTGEKRLEYNDDFKFLPDETSETIADTVCSLVPALIAKYGEDEVMVLTAYRKRTASGANALNFALRSTLRKDITETTAYFEKQGIRIYVGDKVMNTKNTDFLTNGDIGKVCDVVKGNGSLIVTCEFDGERITLEDEEVNAIELAYATTVHKSQGSEAKAVVLVTDMAHKVMLRRNLFYTGVTRAKQKLYIVGQLSAMNRSIDTMDSAYRRSQLGLLISFYKNKNQKGEKRKEKKQEEQQLEIKAIM